jgi:hypothetical protein
MHGSQGGGDEPVGGFAKAWEAVHGVLFLEKATLVPTPVIHPFTFTHPPILHRTFATDARPDAVSDQMPDTGLSSLLPLHPAPSSMHYGRAFCCVVGVSGT